MTDPWLERLRSATVAEVAPMLGFDVVRRSPGKLTYPCPSCGAVKRHTKAADKRGAVDVADAKPGAWFCRQCETGGDAVDFVAFVQLGRSARGLDAEGMRTLERWTRSAFGITDDGRPRQWARRDPIRESLARAASAPRVELLPADEVRGVWELGLPVTGDPEACAWLAGRGIDPARVALADLARALPGDVEGLPPWAGDVPSGGPHAGRWTSRAARGWRLIVPMFDTSGTMRSFRFRRFDQPSPNVPKSLGAKATGCVFADSGALELLRQRTAKGATVIVAEGEADFLLVATSGAPALDEGAVFGVVAGSITPALGRRILDGSTVILATDDDEQGERYASSFYGEIGHRARLGALGVHRWKPTVAGGDVGTAGGLEGGTVLKYSGASSGEVTR